MARHEITTITVGGRDLNAADCVCANCNKLDLNMSFDTSKEPWRAICSCGYSWSLPSVS
jgi:hypothetical protein